MQYVALRNIDLLLQKQPDILSKELRVFFCKYNDPAYIKFEKLEIMVRIANDKNVDQLLAELKEYALEVDMDIVKRAVKAIGQVAIKIESATERCVNTLLELISTKVNYVVQEAIVVIKDIFRKYPGYEGIIPDLCKCIEDLDEPSARGSLIWIVGEYAQKISNAGDILAGFVDGFTEEFTQVSSQCSSTTKNLTANESQTQLSILTAVVKFFLKKPQDSQAQSLVQKIFQSATGETDNPDVRDRAYVYWRLLSSNPQIAQNVVLSDKPPITSTIQSLPPALLERLLTELSTLSSVYHKPPEAFVGQGRYGADAVQKAAIEEQMQNARENPIAAAAAAAAVTGALPPQTANAENLLDIDFDGSAPASSQKSPTPGLSGLEGLAGTPQRIASPAAMDTIGAGPPSQQQQQPPTSAGGGFDDLMGLSNGSMGVGEAQWNGNGLGGMSSQDILGGFASLDVNAQSQPPPPPGQQLADGGGGKKANEDLLGLF